ncbi:MAG: FAD-dependent oxidoreductase, partial [Tunicatimonas sp.]
LYSKNIKNLFLAGRIISASHVAFGSSRVMATCGHAAQAVGVAAALCAQQGREPADLQKGTLLRTLQQRLLARGQHIPQLHLEDPDDLVWSAQLTPSSELVLTELPPDGPWISLEYPAAQMLPVPGEQPLTVTVWLQAKEATTLNVELRISSKLGNHTPDVTMELQALSLNPGEQEVTITFSSTVAQSQYVFVCFMRNEHVQIRGSEMRLTGVLSVFNKFNKAVSNNGKQEPDQDIGVESFEFWCPARRPGGHNLAMRLDPGLPVFGAENLRNGLMRPTHLPNAWVADLNDPQPQLTLRWDEPQSLRRVVLHWDTDFDHPMESSLMGHPESVMPFCVPHYQLRDDQQYIVYEKHNNHQSQNEIVWDKPVVTRALVIKLRAPNTHTPAALLGIRVY